MNSPIDPPRPILDPRRPARRASWLMLGLAMIAFLFAALLAGAALALPSMRGRPEFKDAFEQLKVFEERGIDVQQQFYVGAATMALYAIVSVVVALLLRTGRRGPVVAALVLNGITLGMLTLNLFAGLATPNAMALPVAVLFLGVHVLLLNWLLAARRNVPLVERGPAATSSGLTIPAPPTTAAPMAGYYVELPPER